MTNLHYVVTIVFYQSLTISFHPNFRQRPYHPYVDIDSWLITESDSIFSSWMRFAYFLLSPCILSILFCNLVKEAIMQFGQNKMDDCMTTCRDVCARATRYNSGNWPFLQTKAFYILSAVYRQAKEFDLANEYMAYSTEVWYFCYF